MKASYLTVQAFTFPAENTVLYVKATIYIVSTLHTLFFPQPPAVCTEQSKLPSSTNTPRLFTGRPVIKIIPQYMNTKALIQSILLSSLALYIFSVIKKTALLVVRCDLWITKQTAAELPLLNLGNQSNLYLGSHRPIKLFLVINANTHFS